MKRLGQKLPRHGTKVLVEVDKLKGSWRDSKKCEEEILGHIGTAGATLKDATLEHLEKSNASLLQAFVLVRRDVNSTEKLGRKGKSKEVRDGIQDTNRDTVTT